MKKALVVCLVIIIAVVAVFLGLKNHNTVGASQKFKGTVTKDDCTHPFIYAGGSMCRITIGKKVVAVATGTSLDFQAGQLIGFDKSQDITGKRVEVYAVNLGDNEYSISGLKKFYIKLLP